MNTELVTTPHGIEVNPRFWQNEDARRLTAPEACALFACWALTDENRIVWFEPSNLRSAMWIRNDATNKEIKAATDTLLERGFLVPVQGNDNEHCARAISFEEIEQLGLFEPKEQNNAG